MRPELFSFEGGPVLSLQARYNKCQSDLSTSPLAGLARDTKYPEHPEHWKGQVGHPDTRTILCPLTTYEAHQDPKPRTRCRVSPTPPPIPSNPQALKPETEKNPEKSSNPLPTLKP